MSADFKTWLDGIGVSYAFSGLSDFGITCAQDLTLLRHDDLKDIMKEVGLKRTDQLKLTIAVRKLDSRSSPIMVISEAQHTALKNIGKRTQQAKDALNNLERTSKEMTDNYDTTKQSIDRAFRALADMVSKRRLELLEEAENQYKQKSAMLTKQTTEVALIVAELVETQRDCERLMKIPKLDTLSSREEAVIDSVTKAIGVEFSDQPVTSPKIAYTSSKQDLMQILGVEGRITGGKPAPPVICCQAEKESAQIKVTWENHEAGESFLEFTLQYAPAGEQKEEGERSWDEDVSLKPDAKLSTLTGLKYSTHYVIRMKARNDSGWGDFCDPVQVTTITKIEWKFVGFTTWLQNAGTQSDEQQDILMHEAAKKAYPGSRAASADMYQKRQITNLPSKSDGSCTSFTSPNNEGDKESSAISGHRLKGVQPSGPFDGTYHYTDLYSGSRAVLCVI